MNTAQAGIGSRQLGIILLTLILAGIHISILFPDTLFILNGLGYLGLLAAYFLPIPMLQTRRNLVRWALMGYTLITILAWVAIGDKSWPAGTLGYFTKLLEVLLIVFLWVDRR